LFETNFFRSGFYNIFAVSLLVRIVTSNHLIYKYINGLNLKFNIMKLRNLILVGLCSVLFSFCSSLDVKKFTASTDEGVAYEYEVVVPLTNFVRIRPLVPADVLVGEVTLPTTVKYDGTNYVVSQIAAHAFENYTGITSMTLPSTISTIEDYAFKGCTSMESINTPQPLSTIGTSAFEDCIALRQFDFVASISKLGQSCFANCVSLTDITLPTSLNTIPNMAFYGCAGVKSIFIDATVNAIGANAFAGCTGVTEMTCKAGMPPTANANSFAGIDPNIPVTVPMGGLDFYRTAMGWSQFVNYYGVY